MRIRKLLTPKRMSMKVIAKAILVFAAIGGVISGCATKSEFKDLKNRMDALESNKIQSIEGQISSIDTSIGLLDQTDDQLEGYINALKEQVLELEVNCGEEREALEAAIKALQAEDESLHKQMEELKAYVDTELNGVKDWASATFVTLEEYNKTVDVITGIQAKVDSLQVDIAKEYEAAINEAIEKTAKSMESWVNEQLTGYYDIATMNTKLDSLKSALEKQIKEQGGDLEEQIAQNTKDIEALESELEKTAEEITSAYEDAIKDAIEENNGTITETIQNAIDGVNTKINGLDERVTDIETKVANLEKRMDEVERTLTNLASIAYIPKYADGIERVVYSVNDLLNFTSSATPLDLTLRFDVHPAECADSIVTAYNKWLENKSVGDETPSPLSVRAVYTLTKASAGEFVDLGIKCLKADNGILTVTVSPQKLDNGFVFGDLEAAVILKVDTGYSNIQSDYIRLTASVMPYLIFSAASEQGFRMTLPTYWRAVEKIGPFEYSTDNGENWTTVTESMDYVTFGGDVILMLRGKSKYGTAYEPQTDKSSNIAFSDANVPVACFGDIRALIDWENYSTVSADNASFANLFCDPVSAGFGSGYAVLSTAPALPAKTLALDCYRNMFSGCTSLKAAPELPAKTLATYCYDSMFSGCTSLETAPASLPAEALEGSCYANMFSGCTSLETAPASLPAEALEWGCYANMFSGCTSLKAAPELPAKTLAIYCYTNMFSGCTNLNEVTVKAENVANYAFDDWLEGVAASGMIHKRSSLTLPTDSSSGIPSGWTAVNDVTE